MAAIADAELASPPLYSVRLVAQQGTYGFGKAHFGGGKLSAEALSRSYQPSAISGQPSGGAERKSLIAGAWPKNVTAIPNGSTKPA